MAFDRDAFVADCVAAASESEPELAVREVVADAVVNAWSIDSVLGTGSGEAGPLTLLSSDGLTIQRIQWPGGYRCCPHEHRMWAVVGVYTGQETNRRYARSGSGLRELDAVEARAGDVVVMDAEVIHTVENPSPERTAALHVYGGDLLGVARHGWNPSGSEVPFDDVAAGERIGFAAIVGVEEEQGAELDADARFEVLSALVEARERERRFLTLDEAREIVRASLVDPAS